MHCLAAKNEGIKFLELLLCTLLNLTGHITFSPQTDISTFKSFFRAIQLIKLVTGSQTAYLYKSYRQDFCSRNVLFFLSVKPKDFEVGSRHKEERKQL